MTWISFLLLIGSCLAATLTLAQLPPFPDHEIQLCWSSLQTINGCVPEIYASFINGRIGSLSPACCKAITDISTSCWPRMFPFNPYFPPLLKNFCTNTSEAAPSPAIAPNVNTVPEPVASGLIGSIPQEYNGSLPTIGFEPNARICLQSLLNTQGCIQEIISSFFSFQVRLLSPLCCKAFTRIEDNCWPKVFPFNPFFSAVVKNHCISLAGEQRSIPKRPN